MRRLASTDDALPLPRLLLSVADALLWMPCTAAEASSTRPLAFLTLGDAIEAGYRAGRADRLALTRDGWQMAGPLVTAAVVMALRRRRGWPAYSGQIGWSLVAFGLGMAAGRNQRDNERRAAAAWRSATGPYAEAAFRLGQHDLARAEDEESPHHLAKELLALELLYGAADARSLRFAMDQRKEEVANVANEFGQYLSAAAPRFEIFPRWRVVDPAHRGAGRDTPGPHRRTEPARTRYPRAQRSGGAPTRRRHRPRHRTAHRRAPGRRSARMVGQRPRALGLLPVRPHQVVRHPSGRGSGASDRPLPHDVDGPGGGLCLPSTAAGDRPHVSRRTAGSVGPGRRRPPVEPFLRRRGRPDRPRSVRAAGPALPGRRRPLRVPPHRGPLLGFT